MAAVDRHETVLLLLLLLEAVEAVEAVVEGATATETEKERAHPAERGENDASQGTRCKDSTASVARPDT